MALGAAWDIGIMSEIEKGRAMEKNSFHACATCVNFNTQKRKDGMYYFCSRLGYETKPDYQFNCWTPKEQVVRLMEKRKGENLG
jgi:hypothetical protein